MRGMGCWTRGARAPKGQPQPWKNLWRNQKPTASPPGGPKSGRPPGCDTQPTYWICEVREPDVHDRFRTQTGWLPCIRGGRKWKWLTPYRSKTVTGVIANSRSSGSSCCLLPRLQSLRSQVSWMGNSTGKSSISMAPKVSLFPIIGERQRALKAEIQRQCRHTTR